jgi:MFS family permease
MAHAMAWPCCFPAIYCLSVRVAKTQPTPREGSVCVNKGTLRRVLRHIRHSITHPYPIAGTTAQQREGIKYLWWDLLFANMSVAFYAEFVTLFILELGGTSGMIGTMSSFNNAMTLLGPLIGAMLVARTGKRKIWVVLSSGGLGRLTLALSAVVPLLFNGLTAVIIVIVLMCIRSLAGSISGPPAQSLQGDVFPPGIRSRWNSLAMVAGNVIVVGVVPLAGYIIRLISGAAGYQVTMLIAAVLGFVATWFYAQIPEPESAERSSKAQAKSRGGLALFLGDRRFLLYCGVQFVWQFGIQISGPFFTVHMRENLGLSVDTIALLATATAVVNVFALTAAGRLVNDRNYAKMTALGMLLVPFMPLAWYLAQSAWGVLAAKAYGVVAWACVHVAGLPLILSITPREHRAQFIALANAVSAIAAIIVPIPAGWIYEAYGFRANLLLSAAGRGVAALMFLAMYLRGAFDWSYEERREPGGATQQPA